MVISWVGTTRVDYYRTAVVLIKNLYEIGRQVSYPMLFCCQFVSSFEYLA